MPEYDTYYWYELELLKERIKNLEEKFAGIEGDVTTNDNIMNGLTREQNIAISMILTNPSTSWKVTL